jgi:hypothetical protein
MNENVLFGHVLFSLPHQTKICKEGHKPYCYCWNQLQPFAQFSLKANVLGLFSRKLGLYIPALVAITA